MNGEHEEAINDEYGAHVINWLKEWAKKAIYQKLPSQDCYQELYDVSFDASYQVFGMLLHFGSRQHLHFLKQHEHHYQLSNEHRAYAFFCLNQLHSKSIASSYRIQKVFLTCLCLASVDALQVCQPKR